MENADFETVKKRILLLEDEEILGSLYKKEIEEAGYKIIWLQSTEEVVQTTQVFFPNLILLDNAIREEERSGMDLIPELRKINPHVPIVILSNYDAAQLQEETKGINGVAFLLKIDTPPAVLIKQIQKLLP